jgi:predicted small secreted protein
MIRNEKMNVVKKLAIWCILIICCLTYLGCNTIHGAGQDIEQSGKAIENASGK